MCIVHVEMAVHKESYTVCCYSFDKDEALYKQKLPADYKLILKYLEQLRKRFPDEIECRVDDTVQGPFHLMGIYLHFIHPGTPPFIFVFQRDHSYVCRISHGIQSNLSCGRSPYP